MNEWKDITAYSRDDKERKPRTWELRRGPYLRIVITTGHIYYPESWVMHCGALGMNTIELIAESKQEAIDEAINLVRNRLDNMISAIGPKPTNS